MCFCCVTNIYVSEQNVPYERHWTEFCAPTLHGQCYYSQIKAGYVIMKDFDYINRKYPDTKTG